MENRCARSMVFLFFLLTPAAIHADMVGALPSFSIESPDKKYLFVVLSTSSRSPDDRYPASGLYLNDGSRTPIWTVDWKAYVILPCDGEHVIRRGGWAETSGTYTEEALSFFERNRLQRTYTVKDLVDFPYLLPHSSSHYEWRSYANLKNQSIRLLDLDSVVEYSDLQVDCDTGTLSVQTLHGDSYTFDVRTGEIISEYRPVRRAVRSLTALSGAIYLLYLWLIRKKAPSAWRKTLMRISIFAVCVGAAMILIGYLLAEGLAHTDPGNLTASEVARMAFTQLIVVLPHNWVTQFGLFSESSHQVIYFPSAFLFWTIAALGVGMINAFVERLLKRMALHFSGSDSSKVI